MVEPGKASTLQEIQMGFIDRAKTAAERAQQKLEQKRGDADERQAAGEGAGGGDGIRFDKNGRPVSGEPPPAATPPPPSARPLPREG